VVGPAFVVAAGEEITVPRRLSILVGVIAAMPRGLSKRAEKST
jgi:hypothetical protein